MRGLVGSAAVIAFLLLSSSVPLAGAERDPPTPTADHVLKVGSPDEMKTRNPLPAIAQDPWTRYVLDRVYDTVLLRNATTEAPIAYIAKGVDANEDGTFTPSPEYDVWAEQGAPATPLVITVYYDFNGVRWHDGTQMDAWDLFFSYHLNAMNPMWNSAVRVVFAGGTGATYEAGNRQLNISLAAKNWQGEGGMPGDSNLRFAVTFTLNEPFALLPRTFAPTLLPMHEWSRTGGGRHVDFGCAVWIPSAEATARGIPECGTTISGLYGQGVQVTDTVPGSKPYDHLSAEGWAMTDADVIGSGPFKSLVWIQGTQATLDRNDAYYTGVDAASGMVYDPVLPTRIHKPFIGGILFLVSRMITVLLLRLINGEIDHVHGPVPPEFVPDLLTHPEISITWRAEPGFAFLGYNLRRPPWGYNPANGNADDGFVLRQAISHVIDRVAFVSNLLQNFGVIAYGFISPANTFWYDDNIPKPTYDLSAAMVLLDSAQARAVGIGPKLSGQVDTLCDQSNPSECRNLPGIGTTPFYVLTPAADYDPVRAAAGAMIADAMRQVGLNAVSQPTAFGAIETAVAAHSFDLYIFDWELNTVDPDYLFDLFDSSNAAAGRNYPGFNNATFDQVIERSRAELDRATRRGYIFSAQEALAAARPYDLLYYRQRLEAYRQDHFVNWTTSFGTNWNEWSLLGIHPPQTYNITITTAPAGLMVVVGGTTQAAPVTVMCTSSETVTVGAITPQVIGGSRYTFVSWSDGGAVAHSIACTGNAVVVATFSVEHSITALTIPGGLNVTVGGVTGVAPVSQWCPDGSTITVAAPTPQGSGDTRLAFASWSDGGVASHTVPCSAPATITAAFSFAHHVTVQTVPAGLSVTVAGVTGPAPVSQWCPDGSSLAIAVSSPQGNGDSRFAFASWSDGGVASHTVPCSAPATITATFETEFRITVESDPAGAPLTLNATAATPDGFWCHQGAAVAVGAPREVVIGGTSYRFVRWSDGGAREHAADCTAPARITATFQEVPFLEQHATALGGIGAVAAILAVLLAFLWRRRKKRQAAA